MKHNFMRLHLDTTNSKESDFRPSETRKPNRKLTVRKIAGVKFSSSARWVPFG